MRHLKPPIVFEGTAHKGARPRRPRIEHQHADPCGRHVHTDLDTVIRQRRLAVKWDSGNPKRARPLAERPPGKVDRGIAVRFPFVDRRAHGGRAIGHAQFGAAALQAGPAH